MIDGLAGGGQRGKKFIDLSCGNQMKGMLASGGEGTGGSA